MRVALCGAGRDTLKSNMKLRNIWLFALAISSLSAQEVIHLYSGAAPGSEDWNYPEKQYFSKVWNTEVVTNVTRPTLTVYKPDAALANGTSVVICPGGGFMALSIASEGTEVAKWLASRGVTAFVLKYRLAHTGEDATQEFTELFQDKERFGKMITQIVPLSIADGLASMTYVRRHAADWNLAPDRVGIIGFSAGGTVTAAVGFRYTPESRPVFLAPIYAAASAMKDAPVPADAPPMFLAAATDDQLHLAADSVQLYTQWTAALKSAELHMYAKGGHGFGMRKQGFPSDHWIERFGEWLDSQGLLKK
jgi:acetyl esterase/lipase